MVYYEHEPGALLLVFDQNRQDVKSSDERWFLKAAALSPALRVADCAYNTQQIIAQLREAAGRGVKLAVFPEFCLTGYTCGDLFLQRTLQQGALTGLQSVLDASKELDVVALVGLPLLVRGKLYNCAAVLCKGQLLGLVPKTYLPNYGEFYESASSPRAAPRWK